MLPPRLINTTSSTIARMRPTPPPTARPKIAPVERTGEEDGEEDTTVLDMEILVIPYVEQNESENVAEGDAAKVDAMLAAWASENLLVGNEISTATMTEPDTIEVMLTYDEVSPALAATAEQTDERNCVIVAVLEVRVE